MDANCAGDGTGHLTLESRRVAHSEYLKWNIFTYRDQFDGFDTTRQRLEYARILIYYIASLKYFGWTPS